MAADHGLQGKTVLITGAAGGIGQALARAFAAQGVRLMLLDRADTGLHALATELGATAAVCDLGDGANRWLRLQPRCANAGEPWTCW